MHNTFRRIDRYEGINRDNLFADSAPTTVAPETLPPPAVLDPLMLDIGEQLALLKLRRSDGTTAVYNRLIQNGAAHPDTRYFRMLCDKALAQPNQTNRFHAITAAGHMAAEQLILHYCNDLNIHVAVYGSRGELECACGWKADRFLRRSKRMNTLNAFDNHVRTAEQMRALYRAMKPPGMETS